MRIASWNIAGGRRIKSLKLFDYEEENLPYFIDELGKVSSDIICLQEIHLNKKRSIAEEIADNLGLSYCFDIDASHSHIDSSYSLGNSIISKFPFKEKVSYTLPYPEFDLIWSDGRKVDIHHKVLQIIKVDGFSVANTQMLPIQIWGYDYDKGEGTNLSKSIEKVFLKVKNPAILCGDFNFNNPQKIFPIFFKTHFLEDATPKVVTRPGGKRETPDHIFYTREFELKDSGVIKTQTDHYLCWADLELLR